MFEDREGLSLSQASNKDIMDNNGRSTLG